MSSVIGVVAITLVVWAVMSVRSNGLRVFLYALPVPLTIALLAGPGTLDGGQFLGILLLVVFWYFVAAVETIAPSGWGTFGGVAGYLLLAAALNQWVDLTPIVAFVVAAAGLVLHRLITMVVRSRPGDAVTGPGYQPVAYLIVPVTTALAWMLGGVLGPFVVTFPYSGIPTAIAIRGHALGFAVGFGDRAWMLLGFLGAFHAAHVYLDRLAALGIAWLFFALWVPFILRRRRSVERVA